MPFQIVRNDITKMKVDAVVNTANAEPLYGPGIDCAIYQAAGEEKLLKERQKIGRVNSGEAFTTPAFDLPAKYIIHTVGMFWIDGKSGEEETLRSCYREVFKQAELKKVDTLAIPLLASGSFGYPKGVALRVALSEIESFLKTSDMSLYLVVFDKKSYELSSELYGDIDSYISERYVDKKTKEERRNLFNDSLPKLEAPRPMARRMEVMQNCVESYYEPIAESTSMKAQMLEPSLDKIVLKKGKTFLEMLNYFADEKGLTDAQLQNRANVDRRTFSKIRCGKTKAPSKATIFAFAIALELNLDEAKDLLASAGLAFSPSELTDLIVQYFIEREIYDMGAINLALFEHEQPSLGALAKVS